MEARQAEARRRARRRQRVGTGLVGVAAAASLLWLARSGPTDISLNADLAPRIGSDEGGDDENASAATSTTLLAALLDLDGAPDDMILVRSADTTETLASAMVVRDGYVITSGQAIGDADEVLVSWGDRDASGTVVGHDEQTDITVIRIDDDLPMDGGRDGSAIGSGDVVTIGLTTGESSTQTVVDGMSSTALEDGAPIIGVVELDGKIGEIEPGTPAYDASGDVVGVTSATADSAPAAIVPIEVARAVADDIIDTGGADHPKLGLRAKTSPDEPSGSLVTSVAQDGPAARGGVEVGDVIVAIDDLPIDSVDAMVATLRTFEPGDAVAVLVMRDGETVTCPVALESADDA